ncbi:Sodium/Potassium/Calcium Exchanger 4 [Manis pentadactyla]|nr:Sodium/Potassium/Calcium Exchanger 4 [Manis pentadactyla]
MLKPEMVMILVLSMDRKPFLELIPANMSKREVAETYLLLRWMVLIAIILTLPENLKRCENVPANEIADVCTTNLVLREQGTVSLSSGGMRGSLKVPWGLQDFVNNARNASTMADHSAGTPERNVSCAGDCAVLHAWPMPILHVTRAIKSYPKQRRLTPRGTKGQVRA